MNDILLIFLKAYLIGCGAFLVIGMLYYIILDLFF
jgi:hypothetical protein